MRRSSVAAIAYMLAAVCIAAYASRYFLFGGLAGSLVVFALGLLIYCVSKRKTERAEIIFFLVAIACGLVLVALLPLGIYDLMEMAGFPKAARILFPAAG